MTSRHMQQTSFLDLLFENRNKDYGAYVLRKQYPQRLMLATGLSLSMGALLLLSLLKNHSTKDNGFQKEPDEVIVRTQIIPEPPKQPELPKPAQLKQPTGSVRQKTFTQIRITPNVADTRDVPTQTYLTDVVISNRTVEGTSAAAAPSISETGAATKIESEEKPTAGPTYAEPQFPGGASAWAAFLSRNLVAPEALEAGEKKTVLVKFWVSEEGRVTSFEVVQSGGAAFDAEVIRVLKKMPKWKSALRNGQPAAVAFTQPVTFMRMGD